MDKTIEKEFFKAFELGGVVHMCFDWMQQKYDLGFKHSKEDEQKPPKELPEKWRHYYDEILPQHINELADAFDDRRIYSANSPLIDEIADNIDSLTGRNRDVYIFSLLKPFKEFSDKIHPIAIIKELEGEVDGISGIKDYAEDLTIWEAIPADASSEAKEQAQEQAAACRQLINDYEYRIERVKYVANKYCELLGRVENDAVWMQEGTVENYLSRFWGVISRFADRLDALLLERGINLLWYQRECGIYLKNSRHVTDVDYYIGSTELAYKYINEALPKLNEEQNQSQNVEETSAQFEVKLAYIEAVYNFLSGETKTLPDTVSKQIFVDCVRSGNFRPIWETAGIKKAKLKYSIYIIKSKMADSWYRQAANSIGCTPQQCSKANVPIEWKNNIVRIK